MKNTSKKAVFIRANHSAWSIFASFYITISVFSTIYNISYLTLSFHGAVCNELSEITTLEQRFACLHTQPTTVRYMCTKWEHSHTHTHTHTHTHVSSGANVPMDAAIWLLTPPTHTHAHTTSAAAHSLCASFTYAHASTHNFSTHSHTSSKCTCASLITPLKEICRRVLTRLTRL